MPNSAGMKLPPAYQDLLLSDLEPGQIYRRCLEQMAREGLATDYALTEAVVYGCEVRYAIQILRDGRPPSWYNFGDLKGDADARLWSVLDRLPEKRIAFVGSGPYPITAILVQERYPGAAVTCIDNNVVAYFLSQAIFEKLRLPIQICLAEAEDVDYSPFSATIVAAMVSGKRQLLDRILNTSGSYVVLRGPAERAHPRVLAMGSTFRDDGSLDFAEHAG
ncbi:MAG: hypothetical protein HY319_19290 [Armatimonadetes bacterium]|nr:hypothetical protein [Armatimonadota bacterium]